MIMAASIFSFLLLAKTALLWKEVNGLSINHRNLSKFTRKTTLFMSAIDTDSWTKLQSSASQTKVGAALDLESVSRIEGTGAPFVQNKIRLFDSNERPKLTLYRDHAGKYLFLFSSRRFQIIYSSYSVFASFFKT